jgi:hypothetical protein
MLRATLAFSWHSREKARAVRKEKKVADRLTGEVRSSAVAKASRKQGDLIAIAVDIVSEVLRSATGPASLLDCGHCELRTASARSRKKVTEPSRTEPNRTQTSACSRSSARTSANLAAL